MATTTIILLLNLKALYSNCEVHPLLVCTEKVNKLCLTRILINIFRYVFQFNCSRNLEKKTALINRPRWFGGLVRVLFIRALICFRALRNQLDVGPL